MKKYVIQLCCSGVWLLLSGAWGGSCLWGQSPVTAELLETSLITDTGLYFDGSQGTNYQYGRRITPHGDCVDVIGGYVFFTWYRGDMSDRRVVLSRRRADDPEAAWVHITFPHRHVGFRNNPNVGDSHNVSVIGVSPQDSTIHLIYDLHAYRISSHGDNHFNYSVSLPGTAFVPDEEFKLDIFQPKRTFLKSGVNYERLTYPSIRRLPDGSLFARYRRGGSGNGDMRYAIYKNGEWSSNLTYAKGMIDLPFRYSLYSRGESVLNDEIHACFQIRYATDSELRETFSLNSGLYWAYAKAPYGLNDWYDVNDQPISLPFEHPDAIQIGTPNLTYGNTDARRSFIYPLYTETPSGAMHALVRVDNVSTHYWKKPGETVFSSDAGGRTPLPDGVIMNYNGYVIVAYRISNRLILRMTPEGEHNWTTLWEDTDGDQYHHLNGKIVGDKMYLVLMNRGSSGFKRPISMRVLQLSGGTTSAGNIRANSAGVKAFPNPVRHQLYLTNMDVGTPFTILDIRGREIHRGTFNGQAIDLAGLEAGAYFLQLQTSEGLAVKKIIIEE